MTIADLKDIITVAGPFLGFLTGWGLFELTERRKVRLAEGALRAALIAELEHAEVLLASIVGRYAYLATSPAEIQQVASEIRWFLAVGRLRAQAIGLSEVSEPPAGFASLSDEQLVAGFTHLTQSDRMGPKLILPVIDSALAGHTSGFTSVEIQALSSVRWQAFLLAEAEFLRLTFTVTDAENHDIVTNNFAMRTRGYARRVHVMVGCVRTALKLLG